MRIVSTKIYGGPNQYARFPVIRHTVDLGVLEDYPTGRLPGFGSALLRALPGLHEHGCCYRIPGGFARRLDEGEGTWMGHVWEHVAIELQVVAGIGVSFGKTRETRRTRGEYDMIYEYQEAESGLAAGRLALRLIRHLLPWEIQARFAEDVDPICGWEAELESFVRAAQKHRLGPSTQAIVEEATVRGIPWTRLNRDSLIQLGHGKHQKRIMATVTSNTCLIAAEIASDKWATRQLLEELGLPVPRQERVYTPEEAQRAAAVLGYPVVVKPVDANQGRGVSIRLCGPAEVRAAFEDAQGHAVGRGVLVEGFVAGDDHRLLVIDGRFVAAARRIPGHVIGDGAHTIEQLVEIVNRDPRRGIGHEKPLTRLRLDAQAESLIGKAGFSPGSVLPEGRRIHLRATANLSTGGTAVDVTESVHPANRELALRAVRAVGLDVGGVDYLTPDITRSYEDVRGAIVEVNASPGFRMHISPSEGKPRRVAVPVLDMLFPAGSSGRIPIAAITGTNGKTTTTRMVAHILETAGYHPGKATTDGVFIRGRSVLAGDMTGPRGAAMVLGSPDVDAAVLEVARGGLLRAGLGFERCDVAACLGVASDHLGFERIETLDDLAAIKEIPIQAADDTVVLNADDPRVLQMGARARARHVCYVTMDPHHFLVSEHIRQGGRAVRLERRRETELIVIHDAGRRLVLLEPRSIPATLHGRARHNVQNAMFAAAVAYALGKSSAPLLLGRIRQGLRTFGRGFHQAPGRLNVFDRHPFTVILDYAHNGAAAQEISNLVEGLDVPGQRHLVLSAPDNRRDQDFDAIARAVSATFDSFICTQDCTRRGRADGETPALLRRFLVERGVLEERVQVIRDQSSAIGRALHAAAPGDLLVVFTDRPHHSWRQIVGFRPLGRNGTKPTRERPSEPASLGRRESKSWLRRGNRNGKDGRSHSGETPHGNDPVPSSGSRRLD